MHLPDGFLSPLITVPAACAAVPLWAHAARRHFGPAAVESLPAIGSLTALAFVLQTIMIPVPGGTSTHLVGVTLLALVYHPLVAFVCESLVLVVQALFFGAGGITVLAVNALAMGLIGPATAVLAARLLRRVSERGSLVAGAYLGMQASALAVAGVLALQHALSPTFLPAAPAVVLAGVMLPSLTVAGIAEAAYTLLAASLLRKAKLGAPR